ncbi:MAG TPA: SGNH/GDSL hydrolase family protein [Phnomibacter sp.]|nr:SGNH/GDSL hydrolase family protein [Phnomibacter sp.]
MFFRVGLTVLLTGIVSVGIAQTQFIPFNHSKIQYQGRIEQKADAAVLSWSGSSVTIVFKGKSVSAILQDTDTSNYYNVMVDGKMVNKIHTAKTKTKHLLASGLSNKQHTLQLFKRTEWVMGQTSLYGFEIPTKAKLFEPPALPARKIEFYGNSITCGYGVEDSSGKDRGTGYFENNYISYAAQTARHFNAQYSCIARSGIGITISWFPQIMSEMYDHVNAADTGARWDFSTYTPDVVVVNLFQNDSWLVLRPEHPEFKRRFGTQAPSAEFIMNAYQKFIETIRSKYPNAHIICLMGNMDITKEGSVWPGYVQQVVNKLNDPKVYAHIVPFKNSGGHPNIKEQKVLANSLINFMDKHIQW